MAKNDEIDLDKDFDFDDFDDFDDVSVDGGKDDRNPILSTGKAVIKGAAEGLTSEPFLREFTRAAMPPGYSEAFELATDVKSRTSNLYNEARSKLRPAIRDTKRTINALMPMAEKVLPKKLAEKIKAAVEPDYEFKTQSQAEIDNNDINSTLANIFDAQVQLGEADKEQRRTEEVIKDRRETKRHEESSRLLDDIRTSAARLVGYQDSVLSKYQRKSLELQYRQFFATRDLLATTQSSAKETIGELKAISKNTGLPEYVKIEKSEAFKQQLRDKLMGNFTDSVADYTRNFRDNLFKNVGHRVNETVDTFKNAFEMASEVGQSASDVSEMLDPENLMGTSRSDVVGDFAGNFLGQWLGLLAGRKLRKFTDEHEETVSTGADLLYKVRNMPQLLGEWAKSNTDFGSQWSMLSDFGKSLVPLHRGPGAEVENKGSAWLTGNAFFDNQTHRSINEIIPGYLSRIHQSIEGVRTGEMPDRIVFNHERNEFSTFKQSVGDIKQKLIGKSELDYLNRNAERLMEQIDSGEQLSPDARKALSGQFLKDIYENKRFDPARMGTDEGYSSDVSEEIRDELKSHFSNMYELEDNKIGKSAAARTLRNKHDLYYKDILNSLPNPYSRLNLYANTGQREQLRALGLVNRDGLRDTVDGSWMAKIIEDYHNGIADYDGVEGPRPDDTLQPRAGGSGKPKSSKGMLDRMTRIIEELTKLREHGIPSIIPTGQNGPIHPSNGATVGATVSPGTPSPSPASVPPVQPGTDEKGWRELVETIDIGVDRTAEEIRSTRELLGEAIGGSNQLLVKAVEAMAAIADLMPTAGSNNRGANDSGHGPSVGRLIGRSLEAVVDGGIWLTGKSFKGVGWLGKKTGGAAWWLTKKVASAPLALASGMVTGARKLSNMRPMDWIRGKQKAIKGAIDIYSASGKLLIDKAKLAAGEYRDAVTGEVIKRVEDIKGDLINLEGKVVLTLEEYKNNLYTKEGRRIILNKVLERMHGIDDKVRSTKTFKRLRNVWNWDAEKLCDVYVRDKPNEPAMKAVDIQAGKFRDKKSGRVIQTIGDIEGAVVDWDNNLIISDEQFSDGIYDHAGKKLNRNLISRAFGLAGSILKKGFNVGETAFKVARWGLGLFKAPALRIMVPFDVYVRGEMSPRLTAKLIRDGHYICKQTGKVIVTYGDIKGAVVDKEGNELISLAEFSRGLVDRFGRPIEGIPKRLIKLALEGVVKAGRAALKVGRWAFDKAKNVGGAVKDGLGGALSFFTENWISSNKQVKKSNTLLEQIRDILDARLPGGEYGGRKGKKRRKGGRYAPPEPEVKLDANGNPVSVHDTDGDGDRDGSWRDILANKAKKLKNRAAGAIDKLKDKAKEKKGGLMGLLSKLSSGIGALTTAFLTFNPLKFLGKIPGLGKLGKAATAAWDVAKAIGKSKAGLAVGRAAMWVGRQVIWRAATWAAMGLAGIVGTPALIAGAVIVGGYLLYKYLSKENKLTQLRMLQYGIDPDDKDQVEPIAKLEQVYGAHVKVNRVGDVELQGEPDMQKMLEPFGINPEDPNDTKRFVLWTSWFNDRFKHVYCKNRIELAIRVTEADLSDVDSAIKPQFKLPFARGTVITTSPSPYDVSRSPFGEDPLTTGTDKIHALIAEIEKEFGVKEIKTKEGNYKPALQGLVLPERFASNSAADAAARRTLQALSDVEYLTEDEIKRKREKLGDGSGIDLNWNGAPVNKIDEIASIRYRVYGMSKLTVSHVNALMSFEKDIIDLFDYGKGSGTEFSGDVVAIYERYATLFNRIPGNEADRVQWTYWFTKRFLPTILAYVQMILKLAPGMVIGEAWKTLKPDQRLQVATLLSNVKVMINEEEVSVWKIEVAPFPGIEPNTDPASVKYILDALRKIVMDKNVEEAFKSDEQKKLEADFAKRYKDKKPTVAPGTGPLMPTTDGNKVGFMDGIMGGIAGVSDGQQVAPIVTGSGGKASDITSVGIGPLPKNASKTVRWDAVKDIITQGSRMAGVDPALMATMAGVESSMNPNAGAGTSSAKGLYQFIDGTWEEMLKKYGMKYNLPLDANPMDPVANTLMGAEFLKENMALFERKMGRRPTDYELYMMHFLGGEGGIKFFKTPPTALSSVGASKKAISANKPIFYTESGVLRSVGEVTAEVKRRMEVNGRPYGRMASAYMGTGATPQSPALDEPVVDNTDTGFNYVGTPVVTSLASASTQSVPKEDLSVPALGASKPAPLPDMTPLGEHGTTESTVQQLPGLGSGSRHVIAGPSVKAASAMSLPVAAVAPVAPAAKGTSTKEREATIKKQEVHQERQQKSQRLQEAEISRMSAEQAVKVESVLTQQLDVQKTMVVKLDKVIDELRSQSKVLRSNQQNTPAKQGMAKSAQRQTRDANPREQAVDMRSR